MPAVSFLEKHLNFWKSAFSTLETEYIGACFQFSATMTGKLETDALEGLSILDMVSLTRCLLDS